jgi:Family of unknown function (DUF5696)
MRTSVSVGILPVLLAAMGLNGCANAVHSSSGGGVLAPPSELSSVYWVAPAIGSVNQLGAVTFPLGSTNTITLFQPSITSSAGPLLCTDASWDSTGTMLTITYALGPNAIHVTVQVQGTPTSVSALIDADAPVVSSLDMGPLDASLGSKSIAVPYYTSTVAYAPAISQYINAWWDWRATHATALNGTAAQYNTKTDGTRNVPHESLQVAVSPDVDAVLPSPGNAASPYLVTMAGRTVLDIWDSGFINIQQGLAELGDYGISNCLGIIHVWQHFGYDNGLPQHYPANDSLGGGSALEAAMAQGKQNGCLMAVHENYLDYYPDYPGFTRSAVALNSDGSELDGWLNASGIQAYSTKPSWMLRNAWRQSPSIHQAYGTNADYLDVHSAAPISSHGDMDARQTGAAMLSTWTNANEMLWAYERQTHAGPVLGEGLDHWYYSGFLDGVEAQLGAGNVPMNSDAGLPLFVDFDLLRIHPLQVNHGMGYYSRWTKSASGAMTATQMDAHRMQEIAFGHAPFLGDGTWNSVPQALVESNLIAPVAKSYGTASVSSIQYRVNGGWTSSSTAAQSGAFSQAQVAYENGLTIVANSAALPLLWNGLTIPQFGWAAAGNGLTAYTALCGSTVCDYSETATSIFANARNQADWEAGMGYAAPSVETVSQGPGNSFAISYAWQVYRSLGSQVS